MDWMAQLDDWFRAHEQEGIELLAALVRQNTVNPPGDEHLAAVVVEQYLSRHAIACTRHEGAPGRTNVLARVGHGAPVVFVPAHTDVVPVGAGWHTDPFEPVVHNGWMSGRGTTDDKGPLASLLLLAAFLQQHHTAFHGTLLVGAVADEERGSHLGLKYLLQENLVHANYAIVPDTGAPITHVSCGEKGLLHVVLTLHGQQAHASTPEQGVNAIYAAQAFIQRVHTLYGERVGYSHKTAPAPFSPTTVNITKISGGSAFNIVPGQCTVGIDIRFVPGQSAEEWVAHLRGIATELQAQGLCTAFDLATDDAMHSFVLDADNPVVQAIDASVQALTGAPVTRIAMSGTTVCKQLVAHGIPAVGWSQDGGHQAHMSNERIALSEIGLYGRALGLAFLRLCKAW
ncbi:MAG: M20 family metallopeptidase [bacterium]|nr:M20 family metallopeptidase [bacterium]